MGIVIKSKKAVIFIISEATAIAAVLLLMMDNMWVTSVDVVNFALMHHYIALGLAGAFIVLNSLIVFVVAVDFVQGSVSSASRVTSSYRLWVMFCSIVVSLLALLLVVNTVVVKHDAVYKAHISMVDSKVCSVFDKPAGEQPIDVVRQFDFKSDAFTSFVFKDGYLPLSSINHGSPMLTDLAISRSRARSNERIREGCLALQQIIINQ